MQVYKLTDKGQEQVDDMGEELGFLESPSARVLVYLRSGPVPRNVLEGFGPRYREALSGLKSEGYIWIDEAFED